MLLIEKEKIKAMMQTSASILETSSSVAVMDRVMSGAWKDHALGKTKLLV